MFSHRSRKKKRGQKSVCNNYKEIEARKHLHVIWEKIGASWGPSHHRLMSHNFFFSIKRNDDDDVAVLSYVAVNHCISSSLIFKLSLHSKWMATLSFCCSSSFEIHYIKALNHDTTARPLNRYIPYNYSWLYLVKAFKILSNVAFFYTVTVFM